MDDKQLMRSLRIIKSTLMKAHGSKQAQKDLLDLMEEQKKVGSRPDGTKVQLVDATNVSCGRVRLLKPPAHPPLQGRDIQMDEIIQILNCKLTRTETDANSGFVLVYGEMGVGKTMLVTQCFHTLQRHFPNHHFLWVRGNNFAAFRNGIVRFGRMVVPSIKSTTDEQTTFTLTLDWLNKTTQPWVLMIDDLRKSVVDQLAIHFPNSFKGTVVCTSFTEDLQLPQGVDDFSHRIQVEPLATEASMSLLLHGVGWRKDENGVRHNVRDEIKEHEVSVKSFLNTSLGNLPVSIVIDAFLYK